MRLYARCISALSSSAVFGSPVAAVCVMPFKITTSTLFLLFLKHLPIDDDRAVELQNDLRTAR